MSLNPVFTKNGPYVYWLLNALCRLCLEKNVDVIATIDNVLTSDQMLHMCVNRSSFYHCRNFRKRFVFHYIACRRVLHAQLLLWTLLLSFKDKPEFYMLLTVGSLILGILGKT